MIYFAFRKIGFVDEVIYCKLMAVISRAQMEIALRFDGILGTANGLCEHFSFTVTGKQNKTAFPRVSFHTTAGALCTFEPR